MEWLRRIKQICKKIVSFTYFQSFFSKRHLFYSVFLFLFAINASIVYSADFPTFTDSELHFDFPVIHLPEITWNLYNFNGIMTAYISSYNGYSNFDGTKKKEWTERDAIPLEYWQTILDLHMEDLFWVRSSFCAGSNSSYDFKKAFWSLDLLNKRTFFEFQVIGLKSLLIERRTHLNPFAGYAYLDYWENSSGQDYVNKKTLFNNNENSVYSNFLFLNKRYHAIIAGMELTYDPYSWITMKADVALSPFSTGVNQMSSYNEIVADAMQFNYGAQLGIKAFLFSVNFTISVRNIFELPDDYKPKPDYIRITEYGVQAKIRL